MKIKSRVLPSSSIASEAVLNIQGTITAKRTGESGMLECHVRWDDGERDWYPAAKLYELQ